MSGKRNIAVDSLKGAAIITVVFGHIFRDGLSGLMIGEFGRWCVPAFFIIQGFFLKRSMLSPLLGYSLKKIKRIYLPFLIWAMVYGIYFWLVDKASFTLSDIFLGKTAVHLYFIVYYMLFALLLPLLYRLPPKARHWCYWLMILSNFAVLLTLELQRSYGLDFFTYTGVNPVKWWGFVAIGMLLGEYENVDYYIRQHRLKIAFIFAGLAVLGGVLPFLTGTLGYMYNRWTLFPLAIGGTFSLAAYFAREGVPGREVLAKLGRRSFSLYLSHFLVVHFLKYVLQIESLLVVTILTMAIYLISVPRGRLLGGLSRGRA